MYSARLHCIYNATIAFLAALSLCQTWRLHQARAAKPENRLHELAVRLHEAALPLRAVPQGKDGLFLGAIYLTETELSRTELRRMALDPAKIEMWTGTVVVIDDCNPDFTCDTGGWGENGMRCGSLVLFGDKALLERIRQAYGN